MEQTISIHQYIGLVMILILLGAPLVWVFYEDGFKGGMQYLGLMVFIFGWILLASWLITS